MTSSRTSAAFASVLLVAAVYLIARPYLGVAHDAQLYVAQALNRQSPGLLGNDLFFRYGSQDRFTVFSAIFGPLVAWRGVDQAAIASAALGAGFALASAWFALRALTDGTRAMVAAVILAAYPGWYGGLRLFSLFEPFAAPRVWACGLILLGMAAAVRGRAWASVLAMAAAMAVHPLMALPGIAWIAFATWPRRYVLMSLSVAGIATIAAWAASLPPFDRIMLAFDPAWLELVQSRSRHLFAGNWDNRDLEAAGCSILVSILVAMRVRGMARRVFATAAGIGAVGLVVTMVGSDWIGSIVATQLQPWRALWISTLAAGAGLGLLVARGVAAEREDWIAIAGGISGSLLGVTGGFVAAAASIALLTGYRLSARPEVRRLLLIAAALTLAEAVVWYALGRRSAWLAQDVFAPHEVLVPFYLRDPALLALLGIVVIATWNRWQARNLRIGLTIAAVIATVIGAIDWVKVYHGETVGHRPLPEAAAILARIPQGASVFWKGDALIPWLGLGRPSYLSYSQTAGIVFSRDTALEAWRRIELVESMLGSQPLLGFSKDVGKAPGVQKALDSPEAVGLCMDRELGGVYVSDASGAAHGVPIHDRGGVLVGQFVICDDVRQHSRGEAPAATQGSM